MEREKCKGVATSWNRCTLRPWNRLEPAGTQMEPDGTTGSWHRLEPDGTRWNLTEPCWNLPEPWWNRLEPDGTRWNHRFLEPVYTSVGSGYPLGKMAARRTPYFRDQNSTIYLQIAQVQYS